MTEVSLIACVVAAALKVTTTKPKMDLRLAVLNQQRESSTSRLREIISSYCPNGGEEIDILCSFVCWFRDFEMALNPFPQFCLNFTEKLYLDKIIIINN